MTDSNAQSTAEALQSTAECICGTLELCTKPLDAMRVSSNLPTKPKHATGETMLRYLCVCAILGFLLSQSPASAKESSRRPADLLPNGKEVRNAASIDFAAILPTANACWVLASVDHAADSGRFVVRSFAIDGATGKIIKTKGQDFIQLKGTVHILGTLTGKVARKDYPFDWQIPSNMFEMPRIIEETLLSRLSGFRGIVLFPLPADWETPQELPFHSIPAQWQEFVLPAWKFYQAHPDIFNAESVDQNRDQLQKLLVNENPFLAVAACRTLTQTRAIEKDFIIDSLPKASGLKQAVFTYLLLKNGPQPIREAAVANMGEVIEAAEGVDTLRGIALGALTALREPNHRTSFLGFRLLEKVEKKQSVFGAKTDAERSINSILKAASLPLLRQNVAFMMSDPPQIKAAK